MYITKNWLYKNITSNEIFIWDNLIVAIFDNNNILNKISVWENSKCEYFWFFSNEWDYEKLFLLEWENCEFSINSLSYSKNNKLNVKILWEAQNSNIKIKTHILSFVWENWNIKIDGSIKIDSWLSKVSWILKEENIYLWNNWKISWIPTLLIESNDVEASHSCNIEKISDEKLFYLRSRWIWKENALRIIIEARIKDLYKCLFSYDSSFENDILENIIDMIVE